VSRVEILTQAEQEQEPKELPRRLCSEIQLFDLCERERCRFKDDRFCTDPEMLTRFEAIAEPEDRPAQRFDDDSDDDEELYHDEQDDDDDDEGDDYSVFDDEDGLEQDEEC
jgi:hypothetical protein